MGKTAYPLTSIDYRDRSVQDIGGLPARSAAQWSRNLLEDAPVAMRAFLLAGWACLGLRPRPGDSERVLGWTVAAQDERSVVLAARSAILTANLIVTVGPRRLAFDTWIEYGRLGRAVWTPVAPLHRRVVAHLLARAAARG